MSLGEAMMHAWTPGSRDLGHSNLAGGWPGVGHRTEIIGPASHPIRVEVYQPPTAGTRPAVLFLHGATDWNARYHRCAASFALCGYHTFAPHLFDSSEIKFADDYTMKEEFFHWLWIARMALAFIAPLAGVQPSAIGLAGVSLGASIALALAPACPEIQAVAALWGDMPDFMHLRTWRMAPTLLVHGSEDRKLPMERILRLVHLLKRRHIHCELLVYPGERHVFKPKAGAHAVQQAIRFLGRYL
jgi:dienelactone hydrolase